MLFKVIVFAVMAGLRTPIRLEPQFEADDEADAKAKLDPWLATTGYVLDPEAGEPQFIPLTDEGSASLEQEGPHPAHALLDEMGSKLAAYQSTNEQLEKEKRELTEEVENLKKDHAFVVGERDDALAKLAAAGSVPKEPEDQLVIGETKNADGATYMGHDAHGNAVWDPAPDSDGPSSTP